MAWPFSPSSPFQVLKFFFFFLPFYLFIHILKRLHNHTKTNHLIQKGKKETPAHMHRQTIRINKITDGHLAKVVHVICTVLFVFLYMCLYVLPYVPVCVCSLHFKTLLTYHNLSFYQSDLCRNANQSQIYHLSLIKYLFLFLPPQIKTQRLKRTLFNQD